jgi:signal transduction histidine kinase/ligand-binding sensor domain-containing protein/CheY-like chemotaxis protein
VKFLLFFYLFLQSFSSFSLLMALEPQKAITQYKLDIWQAERGFEQNSVYAVCQTRDGYIWLGTLRGLVRFDGISFTVFNKDNTRQLKDNAITALLQDQKGSLWIGTSEGGLYCLTDGEFKTHPNNQSAALREISTIFEDRSGVLWIGTMDSGLTRLKKGAFTTFTTRDGLSGNRVRAVQQDRRGNLRIATSAGLTIRSPEGRFTPYNGKIGLVDKYIISLCERKNRELWIGCNDGLYCLKDDNLTHYGMADGLPNQKIMCLYEDRHRNLWAGTDGGGLIRIKEGRIETFSITDGLTSDCIYSLYEDMEGSLWIGTLKGGLHRLRDTTVTTYTTKEGLSHNMVSCIFENRAGNLWIGTGGGGVNRLKYGKLNLKLTTKQGLLSNVVHSLIEDRAGNLWIGTKAGLNRFKAGRLTGYTIREGLSDNQISKLFEDKQGTIWISLQKNLNRFHKGKFIRFTEGEEVANKVIRCLYQDREASLWFGTYGSGLYRFKDGTFTPFTTREGLVNNEVECIYEDENGVLYIGTRGGLSRLAGGKFTNFTSKDGLMDSDVRVILEDDPGHLWLGGRDGISRINKKELSDFARGKTDKIHPLHLDESDGMKNPWCKYGTKTRDGRLWFATDMGVAAIDPGNIKKNTLPPPVVIEEVKADGELIDMNRKREPFVIPPGKKRIEFYYTGLTFIKPRKGKFKLKLAGYDNDWIDVGNARSTTYTGLSPGKYTFNVMACNGDGVWDREGASLSFYLQPYFYQTAWFYLLAGLFVLLVGFSLYRFRVRQLHARKEELGALVEIRTRDLKHRTTELENAHQKLRQTKEIIEGKNLQLEEQSGKLKEMDRVKSRFFANISHEFRTPLTLIMGPLEQMLSRCPEKEQQQKLGMMLRNSRRLLSLINQLLDLSKFESGKMKLQASQQNIIPFLKGIVDSFDSLMAQNELGLRFHTREENITLYFDGEKIENVVCNLLINAVKFTPPGGQITVTLKIIKDSPPGFLEISVRDTGIGIPAEQLDHIFDRFYQAEGLDDHTHKGSGIGLALTKELVALHHGEITVHSVEGKGSEFTIRLPLGDGHLGPGEIVRHPEKPAKPGDLKEKPDLYMIEKEEEADQTGNEIIHQVIDGNRAQEKNIILVVEDSADVRSYIRSAIEPDYQMIEAKDGREGIKKALEIIPDLVISDIMMPGADGYELCRVLKNDVNTSHVPIILLTAKAAEEDIIEGLESKADDYITKPFNTRILSARIKNLIDIRSQLQENLGREMTFQPAKTSISTIDREFLNDLQVVLDRNISGPDFKVDQLCKKLYMSHTSLYRKINALSGETPTEFIRSYRLKKGAELLKNNFGTILEVALEVGFSSANYFTRVFKKKFHQLPSEYQATESE